MVGRWSKGVHWFVATAFLLVAATAVMNQTFYSKEALMRSFEFSFPMVGIDLAPADQLFVARMARRVGWEFHFWCGVALSGLFALKLLVDWKAERIGRWHLLFGAPLFVMLLSGAVLYARIHYPISSDSVVLARGVHHWSAWLVAGLFGTHIVLGAKKAFRDAV